MDKVFEKIGIFIFVGMAILILFLYNTNKQTNFMLEQSELKYKTLSEKYDYVLSLPPDTIKAEPITIKGDTVYVPRYFGGGDTTKYREYKDSIVNDSIDLHVSLLAKDLKWMKYKYKPIFKHQTTYIDRKVPHPIEIKVKEYIPQRGLFLNVGLGYGDKMTASFGVSYLDRKSQMFGYTLTKYGDVNIHSLSYGIRLWK